MPPTESLEVIDVGAVPAGFGRADAPRQGSMGRASQGPGQGSPTVSVPVLRALIRDYTAALGQQMYFWGRDVLHPTGNLLCRHGFERLPSEGLKGTSCYQIYLADGDLVELHGACAGRYPRATGSADAAGLLFIRSRAKVFLYSGQQPPVPGRYDEESLRGGSAMEVYEASCRFLDWWLEYEQWVADTVGNRYRDTCYRNFRKLPASAPWLPPTQALAWLRAYRQSPTNVDRARR